MTSCYKSKIAVIELQANGLILECLWPHYTCVFWRRAATITCSLEHEMEFILRASH